MASVLRVNHIYKTNQQMQICKCVFVENSPLHCYYAVSSVKNTRRLVTLNSVVLIYFAVEASNRAFVGLSCECITVSVSLWVYHCECATMSVSLSVPLWVCHCECATVSVSLWVCHCECATASVSLWVCHRECATVSVSLCECHCL